MHNILWNFTYTFLSLAQGEVVINYNKLHADPKRGKNLDLILKKLKHHMVENMSSSTADALGLSRAILCNDSLIKKLEELERTEVMYKCLVDHTRRVLRGYFDLLMVCKGKNKLSHKKQRQPKWMKEICTI